MGKDKNNNNNNAPAPTDFSKVKWNMTPDKEKKVKELREFYSKTHDAELPGNYHDMRLLRFLAARAYDIPKATEMLAADVEWRDENDVDTILQDFPQDPAFQDLNDYWPQAGKGYSKTGSPVYYECLGRVDIQPLMIKIPAETLIKFHIYVMESILQHIEQRQAELNLTMDEAGVVFVQNLDGLGWRQFYSPGINTVKEMLAIDEGHYPETIQKLLILNIPKIFNFFWVIVKPFMDERTLAKTGIFGTAPHEELAKVIPAEEIPSMLGGPLTWSVPGGGKWVASESASEEPVKHTISAGSNHEVLMKVLKPKSTISWEFKTEANDIGFGIFFMNEGKREEVVKPSRVPADTEPQADQVVCQQVGSYIVQFDNSYSKLRSKTVIYHLFLDEPVEAPPPKEKKNKKKKKKHHH